MGLVTLNQVKYYLNINLTNIEHDLFLDGDETTTGLIDLVSEEFEASIDNDVQIHTREVFVDGSGRSVLVLPYWPIIALDGSTEAERLANLQYRTSATGTWTDLLMDEDLICLDPNEPWAIRLLDWNTFPYAPGERNIRVKYTSGFTECPSDIMTAVLERVVIKFMESKRGEGRLGLSSQGGSGIGGTSTSYKDHQERWDTTVKKYARLI